MKTLEDLKNIIPTILKQFNGIDHEVGDSYCEQDEDGWGRSNDYTTNYFTYEEDGWLIEVEYKCCGEWDNVPGDYWTPPCCELRSAWGEVVEINATHYDEETDEETEFSEDDLDELWKELDKSLENIA